MDKSTMVSVEVPEEIRLALQETSEGFAREIRMAAAAKLFEMGKLSTGRAAQLAGVPSLIFLRNLGRYGVSVFSPSDEELTDDTETALRLARPTP